MLLSDKKRELEKEPGQLRVVELERSKSDLISTLGVVWIRQDNL